MSLTDWIVRIFDVKVPEGGKARFEWGQLPTGEAGLALVIAVAAVVVLTAWLYKREGQASKLRKGFLGLCRVAVFAVLLLVFLEPRLAVDFEQEVEGHTIVLWDTSLSMSLPDRYQDLELRGEMAAAAGIANPADLEALSRHELAWRLVMENPAGGNLLEALEKKNRVLVYGFDGKVKKLSTTLTRKDVEPTGQATDLANAVRKALEDTGGRSIAAVILISDGKINKGEGEQGVVADLVARRIPLFAIGVGDPVPPKNLEVLDLSVEPRVLLGDPIMIEGAIRARGYKGQAILPKLTVRPAGKDGKKGEPVELEPEDPIPALPDDDVPLRIRWRYKPEKEGDFVLKLALAAKKEEPVKDDNQKEARFTVSDDKTKVLLIAGGPNFEYHFLRTRLTRERAAVVSCWLQSADPKYPQAGNERIEALPRTLEELKKYDAIVLLDPNPDDFDAASAKAYRDFVAEHKGGLLFIPSTKYSASFFQRAELKPFLQLLPVIPGDFIDFTRAAATERHRLKATLEGADHPATRIATRPELCRELWGRLPGPFFSYPVTREKLGAEVLVRHQIPGEATERGGRALIVAQFFQGGPVIYQGTDETWRWRSVAGKVFDRYWVSVMRYLIQGRIAGGRKRLEFLADKGENSEYFLGEPIRLRAHALDPAYRPLKRKEGLTAKVKIGKGEEVEVHLRPTQRPGHYEGSYTPPVQGTITFALRLPDAAAGSPPVLVKAQVRRSDMELADPRLDRTLLESIAKTTGGQYLTPSQAANLARQVPDAKPTGKGAPTRGKDGDEGEDGETKTEAKTGAKTSESGPGSGTGRSPKIESKRRTLIVAGQPIKLWDTWRTLLLLLLFLTFEWAIRKRSKMI